VDCQGSGEYLDIVSAVDDAHSGDTIWVAPCTYEGSISLDGKSVAIRSIGGANESIIVATHGEPVVTADRGEGAGTVIEGFTLTGGGGPLVPAIDDEFSQLTLRDDVISGNRGSVTVYNRAGHLVLERTRVEDNTTDEGMVIQSRRGEITVKDSLVRCGANAMGYVTEHGAAFADGSTFDCPGATALSVYHSAGRVERSTLTGLLSVENEWAGSEPTFVEDSVLVGGAAVSISNLTLRNVVSVGPITADASILLLEASIVTGAACGLSATGTTVTTRYDVFWHNTSDACGTPSPVLTDGTSRGFDPGFADAAAGDYQLSPQSGCVDAGPPERGYADPDGSRNDIGAFGGPLAPVGGA
jgi:hypothetical protein